MHDQQADELVLRIVDGFNALEAVFWGVCAVAFVIAAVRRREGRLTSLVAAFLFAAFAGSDVVEVETHAWYRPWWLAAWKGSCIAGLVALWGHHKWSARKNRRRALKTDLAADSGPSQNATPPATAEHRQPPEAR